MFADNTGSGGTVAVGGFTPYSGAVPYQQMSVSNGVGTATWEVTASSGAFTFNLLVSNPSSVNLSGMTITGSLAAQTGVGGVSAVAPIPRFIGGAAPAAPLVTLNLGVQAGIPAQVAQAIRLRRASLLSQSGLSQSGNLAPTVTFAQTVTNNCPTASCDPATNTATNGVLGGTLPPTWMIDDCNVLDGGSCQITAAGNGFGVYYTNLGPGQSATVVVQAHSTNGQAGSPEYDSSVWSDLIGAGTSFSGYLQVENPPVLGLVIGDNGPFQQLENAMYTLTVSNTSTNPLNLSGLQVRDEIPPGLTLTSMAGPQGSPWGPCPVIPQGCLQYTSSTLVAAGAPLPLITVTAAVTVNAPAHVTDQVTVSVYSSVAVIGDRTTTVQPAGCPSGPVLTSPANGASGVTMSSLSWSAATGATSYDVYFGTSSSPPKVTNTAGTTYSTGTLASNTTYYWRIVAIFPSCSTSSPTWSFTTATLAPASVSPGAGSGTTQTFTFTFTDSAGYSDLTVLDVLINNYLDGIGACYFAWVPAGASAGYLYLVDDAGDGGYVSGSPMLFPTSNSLQNSQCTINGTGSSVSSNGNTLTLTLAITFKPGFGGNKIFYTAARSNTQNSGWQALGTWNVPGTPPVGPGVGGVSPGRSTSMGQVYTFTFTDTNGYADLNVLDVLTNSFLDGVTACYFAYVPSGATTGYLYLVDDAGDGGYAAGSPMLLSSGGTLQNSQCTINTVGSSASASGNTLNLNLNITFKAGFAGNQIFYLAARNSSTGNSGWQSVGSVTVP
jgi:uncharacterized repeat protein (TIGR01451 family)